MLYQATHVTRYLYEHPVSQCLTESRLTPRTFDGQRLHTSRIRVHPEPAVFEQRKDYFGNDVSMFAVLRSHDKLTTTATSVVEVAPHVQPESAITWEATRELLAEQPDLEALQAFEFVFASPLVPVGGDFLKYGRAVFTPGRPLLEGALALSHKIHEEFKYKPKSTAIDTPLAEIIRNRKGVCQDFAHVMIAALRSLRLSARYVSGYLRSGADYQGAEASHAWVSVFVPGQGWASFDPTNDLVPSDGHVTLAWGRDYSDVTPLKGITLGGGGQSVEVEVQVRPIQDPDLGQDGIPQPVVKPAS
jgi:transglutaminase-like putative cysteine protease